MVLFGWLLLAICTKASSSHVEAQKKPSAPKRKEYAFIWENNAICSSEFLIWSKTALSREQA